MSAKKAPKKAGKKAAKKAPNGFRANQKGMDALLKEMPKNEPVVPTEVKESPGLEAVLRDSPSEAPGLSAVRNLPSAEELLEQAFEREANGQSESVVYGPLGGSVGEADDEWEDVPAPKQEEPTEAAGGQNESMEVHRKILAEEFAKAMNETIITADDVIFIAKPISNSEIVLSLERLIIGCRYLYKRAEKKRVGYDPASITTLRSWIDEAERQIKVLKDEEAQVPAQG